MAAAAASPATEIVDAADRQIERAQSAPDRLGDRCLFILFIERDGERRFRVQDRDAPAHHLQIGQSCREHGFGLPLYAQKVSSFFFVRVMTFYLLA